MRSPTRTRTPPWRSTARSHALEEASPNARDYYVQEANAFARAQDEHRQRINCLRGVLSDMEALTMHCADPGAKEG